jgi:hypothetical protein
MKCSLYQGKYNRQSSLSLSVIFLKCATVASYLDPKPTDAEVVEAIRYHFSLSVQREMLNMQLNSIGEAVDLLQRLKIMQTHEMYDNNQSLNVALEHNNSR